MDTTKAFGRFVTEETFSGKIPGMEMPKTDHNADLAIEFAEWIQNHGWTFRHGHIGLKWYSPANETYAESTKDLLAEFIRIKSAKPKTDQERIAELELKVAQLREKLGMDHDPDNRIDF